MTWRELGTVAAEVARRLLAALIAAVVIGWFIAVGVVTLTESKTWMWWPVATVAAFLPLAVMVMHQRGDDMEKGDAA